MMKTIVAFVLFLAVVQSAPTTEMPQIPCICTMDYRPVCGVDGVTYGNKCGMNCANVQLAYEGECGKLCPCPRNLEPVCGTDGQTYDNKCLLTCAGAAMVHEGSCTAERAGIPCICPFIYLPVCGTDGVTYGNKCSMDCAGVEKLSDGQCPVAGTTKAPLGIFNTSSIVKK